MCRKVEFLQESRKNGIKRVHFLINQLDPNRRFGLLEEGVYCGGFSLAAQIA